MYIYAKRLKGWIFNLFLNWPHSKKYVNRCIIKHLFADLLNLSGLIKLTFRCINNSVNKQEIFAKYWNIIAKYCRDKTKIVLFARLFKVYFLK